ncbi:MAG: glycoside hydrolase family 25 protein [Erysipelotrichaceae bacterium]|nr:glycoside hydrolase family 25 protein [Erysipelotrichaceae bacterium]
MKSSKNKRRKKKKQHYYYNAIVAIVSLLLVSGLAYLLAPEREKETMDEISIIPNYMNINREGFYTYEDDMYTSRFGIDVSEHNGDIDFKKVKEEGVEFVFIRIGWRGYSEGRLYEDNRFEEFYKAAKENGLDVGVYFFSQAINEKEALEEADFVLKTLNKRKLDLPVVYDFETIDYDEARSDNLSNEERTANAKAFLERVSTRYEAMLYGNHSMFRDLLYMEELMDYPLWYAQYNSEPQYGNPINIWQYSENGVIEGIQEKTDLNIMFVKKDS